MIQTEIQIGNQAWSFRREAFSEGYQIPSLAFVCPVCVQVWGRSDIGGNPSLHIPQMVSCMACAWSDVLHPVPGTIIACNHTSSGVDWALLEALPEELLRREFDLTQRNYENRYESHEAYINSQIALLLLPSQRQVDHHGSGLGV